jgi:hypothetical protein
MMVAMRRIVGCIVMVGVTGCFASSRVDIRPLPASMTPQQRVEAFQYYRRGGQGVEYITQCTGGRPPGCLTHSRQILVLNDGTQVKEAGDLLPLLEPNSTAGQAAQRAARARARHTKWRRGSWGTMIGGLALMYVGLRMQSRAVGYIGAGVAFVGTTICIGGMGINGREINEESRLAFAHYDQGLADRLRLCVHGLAMVPCESHVPGAPPPAVAPDPVLRSLRQR